MRASTLNSLNIIYKLINFLWKSYVGILRLWWRKCQWFCVAYAYIHARTWWSETIWSKRCRNRSRFAKVIPKSLLPPLYGPQHTSYAVVRLHTIYCIAVSVGVYSWCLSVCLSVCLSRHVHVYGNGGTYPETYPASRTIPVVPTRHYYSLTISETVQDRHICIIYYEIVQFNYVQCPRNYCDGVTLNQCLINNNNNN